MIQIELENGTPFRRRIFLHASDLPVTEPIPLALTAWKYFDLAPGATVGTVDGEFQIGVRVSRIVHGVDYRTVVADARFGDSVRVEVMGGVPTLARAPSAGESVQVVNGMTGPQSAPIDVTLYRDYAPLLRRTVPVNGQEKFAYPDRLYCYSSMPFDRDEEALALEPVAGDVDVRGPGSLRLQIVPSGSMIQWKSNGVVVDR